MVDALSSDGSDFKVVRVRVSLPVPILYFKSLFCFGFRGFFVLKNMTYYIKYDII